MGVTLQYCDMCQTKISPDDVAAGEVLKVKDKTFCAKCKPKVLALIQKKQAAAKGAAPPPPAAPRRKAPVRGARRVSEAPAVAKKPAVGRPAVAKPGAKKPTVDGRKKPAVGGRKKVAEASAERPRVAGKRSAVRRAAAARGEGVRAGKPMRGRDAAVDLDAPDESPFVVRKKSNAPVIAIVAVVVIAGLLGVFAMLNQQSQNADDTESETAAKVIKPEPVDPLIAVSEKQLEDAKAVLAQNPSDYSLSYGNFNGIANAYGAYPAGQEAARVANELMGKHREAAQAEAKRLQDRVKDLWAQSKFEEAYQALVDLPRVIQTFNEGDVRSSLRSLRMEAKVQAQAWSEFSELKRKAIDWATNPDNKRPRGYPKIATAIVDALEERYKEEAPDVWRLKDVAVHDIEKNGIQELLNKEKAAAKELAEARALAEKKQAEARRLEWERNRSSVPWVNQIGSFDLYNWVINPDRLRVSNRRWKLEKADGIPTIVGDNTAGGEMYIGPFTDHWQDYVLEFEYFLESGSLDLAPRVRGKISQQAPFLIMTDRSDLITFDEDFGKGKWIKITLEVHGEVCEMVRGDTGERKTISGDSFHLSSQGGFVFYLSDSSKVKIRSVRSKLVANAREPLF